MARLLAAAAALGLCVVAAAGLVQVAQAEELSFTLTEVRLEGNTVLPAETVAAVTKPLLGTRVTMVDLNGLRHALTDAYLDAGYVNSGVLIPDQDLNDGVVVLQAVEGQLVQVRVTEGVRLKPAFIEQRLRRGLSSPLQISELQLSLLELERDPLIERVNARLVPGEKHGQAVLEVQVEEAGAISVGLRADNHRSPSIGAEQLTAWARHGNLTGRGDVLEASVVVSDGDTGGSLGYSLPLTGVGHTLSLYYGQNDSEVVVAPFDRVDVESEVEAYGVQLDWPLLSNATTSLTGFIGFERKHSETFLLGRPFSFSLGAEDGESDASVLALGAEFTLEGVAEALAVRLSVRQGLDVFGATSIDGAPDGEFTTGILQGFYARQIDTDHWFTEGGVELRGRVRVQWTEDSLQAFEKVALGGADTVRGYVENSLLKDRAMLASLELVLPLVRNQRHQFSLVPFVDWARGEDEIKLNNLSRSESLASAGLGFDWATDWGLDMELFWGHSFSRRPDTRDAGLQGDGIHLMVNWEYRL